ncbi:hypothetical protein HWV62_40481 [Athelia sp. TMB]|nr:hypothetical protein HWV62_40481 [Athelia sp. TMB]
MSGQESSTGPTVGATGPSSIPGSGPLPATQSTQGTLSNTAVGTQAPLNTQQPSAQGTSSVLNASGAVSASVTGQSNTGAAPIMTMTPEQLAVIVAQTLETWAAVAPSKSNLPAIDSNLPISYLMHHIPKEMIKAYWKRAYIALKYLTNDALAGFAIKPPVMSQKLFTETSLAGEESYSLDDEDEKVMLSIMHFDEGTRNWLRLIDAAHCNDKGGRHTMWCELEKFIFKYPNHSNHHKALVKYWIVKMQMYAARGDDPTDP